MHMMHTYKSNKYRPMICRMSQKPRNDRKIKTVKFLYFIYLFIYFYLFIIIFFCYVYFRFIRLHGKPSLNENLTKAKRNIEKQHLTHTYIRLKK